MKPFFPGLYIYLFIYYSIHQLFIEKTSLDSAAFLSHNTATGYKERLYMDTHTYILIDVENTYTCVGNCNAF